MAQLFSCIPILLSLMLLGAHFYRADLIALAILALITPGLFFVNRPWSARTLQLILALGSIEWVRTTVHYVEIRQEMGMEWTRLAFILGGVALFTLSSAAVFSLPAMKKRYRLQG